MNLHCNKLNYSLILWCISLKLHKRLHPVLCIGILIESPMLGNCTVIRRRCYLTYACFSNRHSISIILAPPRWSQPCGTQRRRPKQLLAILMSTFLLFAAPACLLSRWCLLNMVKGEPFAKRSNRSGLPKSVIAVTLRGTRDCDLDKTEA